MFDLFDAVTSFDNLYVAYKAAAQGKHDRAEVLRHDLHAEKILWRLHRELRDGSYRHGKYRTFQVQEPKRRDVAAAPFTDRIVHHALVCQIEPLFERVFIYDSYACRRGKGTHAAVLRLQHFLRSASDKYGEFYVLRADIRKFFASINHRRLLALLGNQLHDVRTLALCKHIIGSYHEQPEAPQPAVLARDSSLSLSLDERPLAQPALALVGQPIGNLTSQLFANVYLNHLDQFIKHTLGERHYLRYMDDFLIIHPSKAHLNEVKLSLEKFARDELMLMLHPKKTNIHKFTGQERFVGYDAAAFVRRLSTPTVRRFMRRLKHTRQQEGEQAARDSWQQFDAYASFAHARGLLKAINPLPEKPGKDKA